MEEPEDKCRKGFGECLGAIRAGLIAMRMAIHRPETAQSCAKSESALKKWGFNPNWWR